MIDAEGLRVAVLTRGTPRGADYSWFPEALTPNARDRWRRLTSFEDPTLICEISEEGVALELSGLPTGRRDDVGTQIVNTLAVACPLDRASGIVPGLVDIWLDLASAVPTSDGDRLLALADDFDTDGQLAEGLAPGLRNLLDGASPRTNGGVPDAARSWLGDLGREEHRQAFSASVRSMLRDGAGTAAVLNLVASTRDITRALAEFESCLVVLGVQTEAYDGDLRPLIWDPQPLISTGVEVRSVSGSTGPGAEGLPANGSNIARCSDAVWRRLARLRSRRPW